MRTSRRPHPLFLVVAVVLVLGGALAGVAAEPAAAADLGVRCGFIDVTPPVTTSAYKGARRTASGALRLGASDQRSRVTSIRDRSADRAGSVELGHGLNARGLGVALYAGGNALMGGGFKVLSPLIDGQPRGSSWESSPSTSLWTWSARRWG